MNTFDVIVIGAGPPGEVVAGRCADGGLKVAIVEERLVGGECSYFGCIPSKTLIRPGDVIAAARRVPGASQAITGPLDVAAALSQRDYMTGDWDDSSQLPWLKEKGIELVRGHGRLTGHRTVEVESAAEATNVTLHAARAVVLASGTAPAIPPITGLREAHPWDNRDVTSLSSIPRRLLVLGGGSVGVEMAQALKRLGSAEVTIVNRGARLLSREEPFSGEELKTAFEAEGIDVLTRAICREVRRSAENGSVTATLDDGRTITADQILVALGRIPNTWNLGIEEFGLKPGQSLHVDRQLRVTGTEGGPISNWLFAVGDCTGLALLTHMGKYQARIAGDVILGREAEDLADHGIISRVTFTDPQVAAVGLTEAEARKAGIRVRTVTTGTGEVPGAYTRGNGISGTSHLVVDEDRQVIVGATFTGPDIAELLHSATISIAGEVPLKSLWHAVPAFPTMSEVWLKLLEAYGL